MNLAQLKTRYGSIYPGHSLYIYIHYIVNTLITFTIDPNSCVNYVFYQFYKFQ